MLQESNLQFIAAVKSAYADAIATMTTTTASSSANAASCSNVAIVTGSSSVHCCVCSMACHHTGPMQYCNTHNPFMQQSVQMYPVYPTGTGTVSASNLFKWTPVLQKCVICKDELTLQETQDDEHACKECRAVIKAFKALVKSDEA